jgi:hypothetical protein
MDAYVSHLTLVFFPVHGLVIVVFPLFAPPSLASFDAMAITPSVRFHGSGGLCPVRDAMTLLSFPGIGHELVPSGAARTL